MKSGLLLDVVVGESTPVLELLTSEDKTLLVWRDTFLVLNLRLDVVDGVRRLDLEGDGLTRKAARMFSTSVLPTSRDYTYVLTKICI